MGNVPSLQATANAEREYLTWCRGTSLGPGEGTGQDPLVLLTPMGQGLAGTYFRHGECHSHGHADKEGRQKDLREEGLGVALGTVEAFYNQPVELAQLQP